MTDSLALSWQDGLGPTLEEVGDRRSVGDLEDPYGLGDQLAVGESEC